MKNLIEVNAKVYSDEYNEWFDYSFKINKDNYVDLSLNNFTTDTLLDVGKVFTYHELRGVASYLFSCWKVKYKWIN